MPGATPYYQKAKDLFFQRRTAEGTFEEWGVVVQPNSQLVTDNCGNLVMMPIATAISASYAVSASYLIGASSTSSYAVSASNSLTASYALNAGDSGLVLQAKAGIISGSEFSGSTLSASVEFSTPYVDTNYSVVVTGEAARTFTVFGKTTGGFYIDSNDSTSFEEYVYWQAMRIGEGTSTQIIRLKSGKLTVADFGGTPLSSSITFSTPFTTTEYSVVVSGEDARTFTVENRTAAGFSINTNSSTIFIGEVFWQAVEVGEYN